MTIILNGSTGVSTPAVTDASGGNTSTINGVVVAVDNYIGMRNRIINGDMRIDQRNAGASVTVTSTVANTYTLDRWAAYTSQASKFSVQQSTTAPAGFKNSALITSLSAYTPLSGDEFDFAQIIEGLNISDLGWGTADAKPVTISFRVRSSLTGTFSGSLRNSAANRSYPFTYAINAANTWETKTINIAGDTSGTWLTTNSGGITVTFSLGAGSSNLTTGGAWTSGNYVGATGQTNFVSTNGATFYITGVQLEVGSVATPFERRDYGRELIMCQRYFEKSVDISSAILTNTAATFYGNMPSSIANGNWYLTFPFKVTKRAAPTVTTYPYTTAANTSRFSNNGGTDYGANSAVPGGIYDSQFSIANSSGGALSVGAGIVFGSWFASAEL